MSCPCLQRSPVGGSTLITSAPKSDRITAALGPAMKLAKSTTFSPEKILSPAMFVTPESCVALSSSTLKLGRALFEEGGRALLLVLGRRAEAKVGSLQQQALALARLQPLVRRLKRELDGDGSVRSDLLQDGFGARDQIGGRDDFVDEPDAIGFLRADHLSGEDELQGATLADQPRQPLRGVAGSVWCECAHVRFPSTLSSGEGGARRGRAGTRRTGRPLAPRTGPAPCMFFLYEILLFLWFLSENKSPKIAIYPTYN